MKREENKKDLTMCHGGSGENQKVTTTVPDSAPVNPAGLPLAPSPCLGPSSGQEVKWDAAPTLLERQRENLTARLRREFGLCLTEEDDDKTESEDRSRHRHKDRTLPPPPPPTSPPKNSIFHGRAVTVQKVVRPAGRTSSGVVPGSAAVGNATSSSITGGGRHLSNTTPSHSGPTPPPCRPLPSHLPCPVPQGISPLSTGLVRTPHPTQLQSALPSQLPGSAPAPRPVPPPRLPGTGVPLSSVLVSTRTPTGSQSSNMEYPRAPRSQYGSVGPSVPLSLFTSTRVAPPPPPPPTAQAVTQPPQGEGCHAPGSQRGAGSNDGERGARVS
ncbi:hypothetical protein Pmani_001834 [Petrolisthes manimaculis]|nr:hypothetical protein Pmani_001834 [Petrolisthes manimaculis]